MQIAATAIVENAPQKKPLQNLVFMPACELFCCLCLKLIDGVPGKIAKHKVAAYCCALCKQLVPVLSALPEYFFQLRHSLRAALRQPSGKACHCIIYLQKGTMHLGIQP